MPVRLERPAARHADEFVQAVRRSRTLHRGLVSAPDSAETFAHYVKSMRQKNKHGFLVVDSASGAIAGVVNISEIVRGNFQSAYLGYYALLPHAGKGLMRQGLSLAIGYCFRQQRLHRLEANIQPGNQRSIALVKGLGFRLEGLSPRYLKVCGRWRDHERWAILAEEWQQAQRKTVR
jgi:ribosomal-protein-alanine N-acetyltransferase